MIELQSNETVIAERRKFWLPIVLEGIAFAVIALLPIVGIIAVDLIPSPLAQFVENNVFLALTIAVGWMLVVWIAFFIAWTRYYLDVVVLTTKRLIYVEQLGLFAREISELRIENIQDMRVEIVGLVPSLLGYGNLYIQTAGEQKEFSILTIPNPGDLKNAIAHQHEIVVREMIASGPGGRAVQQL